MSTIKADAIAAVSTNGDLSLDGLGTGGVSIASTLKMTKGGDISSASPLVIDTDGNYFDVTGTTNFSAMTVESGNFFMLQFDGALTITHGSGIELPGAADLTTAAGDRLICYATAADTVEVMSVETEAAAAAGGLVLIGTAVASDSASLTVTGLDATYESYKIIGSNMTPATDNVEPWMRLGDSSGVDSGSTDYIGEVGGLYVGGTTFYGYQYWGGYSHINMGGDHAEMIGNSTGEGVSFEATLSAPRGTQYPAVHGQCAAHDMNTHYSMYLFAGQRDALITTDRVNFLFESGNITTGRLTVFGMAHA